MKTLRSKWAIGLMAAFLYLANPYVLVDFSIRSLIHEADRGALPSNGDSMGMPILGGSVILIVMFVIFLPVYAGLVWFVLSRYQGGLSFAAFDRREWVKSALWTASLGFLIGVNGLISIIFLSEKEIPFGVVTALNAYWLLCIRSSLANGNVTVSNLE